VAGAVAVQRVLVSFCLHGNAAGAAEELRKAVEEPRRLVEMVVTWALAEADVLPQIAIATVCTVLAEFARETGAVPWKQHIREVVTEMAHDFDEAESGRNCGASQLAFLLFSLDRLECFSLFLFIRDSVTALPSSDPDQAKRITALIEALPLTVDRASEGLRIGLLRRERKPVVGVAAAQDLVELVMGRPGLTMNEAFQEGCRVSENESPAICLTAALLVSQSRHGPTLAVAYLMGSKMDMLAAEFLCLRTAAFASGDETEMAILREVLVSVSLFFMAISAIGKLETMIGNVFTIGDKHENDEEYSSVLKFWATSMSPFIGNSPRLMKWLKTCNGPVWLTEILAGTAVSPSSLENLLPRLLSLKGSFKKLLNETGQPEFNDFLQEMIDPNELFELILFPNLREHLAASGDVARALTLTRSLLQLGPIYSTLHYLRPAVVAELVALLGSISFGDASSSNSLNDLMSEKWISHSCLIQPAVFSGSIFGGSAEKHVKIISQIMGGFNEMEDDSASTSEDFAKTVKNANLRNWRYLELRLGALLACLVADKKHEDIPALVGEFSVKNVQSPDIASTVVMSILKHFEGDPKLRGQVAVELMNRAAANMKSTAECFFVASDDDHSQEEERDLAMRILISTCLPYTLTINRSEMKHALLDQMKLFSDFLQTRSPEDLLAMSDSWNRHINASLGERAGFLCICSGVESPQFPGSEVSLKDHVRGLTEVLLFASPILTGECAESLIRAIEIGMTSFGHSPATAYKESQKAAFKSAHTEVSFRKELSEALLHSGIDQWLSKESVDRVLAIIRGPKSVHHASSQKKWKVTKAYRRDETAIVSNDVPGAASDGGSSGELGSVKTSQLRVVRRQRINPWYLIEGFCKLVEHPPIRLSDFELQGSEIGPNAIRFKRTYATFACVTR